MVNYTTNPPDVLVSPPDFHATEVSVTPVSDKGMEFFTEIFGAGVVSATIPKSQFEVFAMTCIAIGLQIQ